MRAYHKNLIRFRANQKKTNRKLFWRKCKSRFNAWWNNKGAEAVCKPLRYRLDYKSIVRKYAENVDVRTVDIGIQLLGTD